MDNRYLKKWFCAPGYDRKMKKMYQEMTLAGHMNQYKDKHLNSVSIAVLLVRGFSLEFRRFSLYIINFVGRQLQSIELESSELRWVGGGAHSAPF
jgi:hypothetical protein